MLALVLRDPAVRSLGRWILLGMPTGSLVWGILVLRSASHGRKEPFHEPANWLAFLAVQWIVLGALALTGPAMRRCSSLDLSLPLDSRRLWVAHTLALVLAGAVMLLAACLVVPFVNHFQDGPSLVDGRIARIAAHTLAALALFVVFLQSMRPSLHEIPVDAEALLWVGLGTAGIVGSMLVFLPLPAAFALVPLALAGGLALWTVRSLPEAFALSPRESNRVAARSRGADARSRAADATKQATGETPLASEATALPASPRVSHRASVVLVWRILFGWRWNTLAVPMLLLYGALLGGLFVERFGDDDLRFLHVVLAAYMLLSFTVLALRRMYLLDPLPISRRQLFALAVLPGYLTLVLGYGAGRAVLAAKSGRADESAPEEIFYGSEDRPGAVLISPRFFEIAWDGKVPRVESPWGESVLPWSRSLFGSSRLTLYKPFTTTTESSRDFVAWQISRATDAVYGATIPPEEIARRYLRPDEVDGFRLVESGLTLSADHPELEVRNGGPVFPVMFLVVGLLWLGVFALYARAMRAGISQGRRKAVAVAILIALFAIHVAQFAVTIGGYSEIWLWTASVQILIRDLGAWALGGAPTVWLACVAILVGAYHLARRSFMRVEIPRDEGKFGLLI